MLYFFPYLKIQSFKYSFIHLVFFSLKNIPNLILLIITVQKYKLNTKNINNKGVSIEMCAEDLSNFVTAVIHEGSFDKIVGYIENLVV